MAPAEEGYTKFNAEWSREPSGVPAAVLAEINAWRDRLRERNLLGMGPDGIGFGNISVRRDVGAFWITGSATGGLPVLGPAHIALVTTVWFERNTLVCSGETRASSESMTHAAFYVSLPWAGAVVHIHSSLMWNGLRERLPATPETAEYGTPELAYALMDICRPLSSGPAAVIMGGHRDGIVAVGEDLERVGALVLELDEKVRSPRRP